ncbi:MFS transporter [Streptoalloteichus hindustanus]|uniref:MFS transporter, DHA1 family, inner membrane transport protein n=1 Tax=Streptoalloteichus hindustanus TaxID=2017 RepID=A0A1M5I4B8_STRHI|nr:MFS transporter [Streptoalloteichus hindustanus]SHG23112.1 MFS transporter, DHA1 family, inner membrane transport protein [Streptoalloteichus hindustanus]
MPLALLALAIGAFGIGTTEFVIMGLLPEVATDLSVSIPTAGLLISGYALGVAIGAPPLIAAATRMRRKHVLMGLMVLFIIGNAVSALAPNYAILLVGRIVAALCHGAFFGVGSVVAATLVAPHRRAGAVALMFSGLTVATIIGVPAGTWLGQQYGWRSAFWAVTALGVAGLLAVAALVPSQPVDPEASLRQELAAFRRPQVWLALAMTTLGFSGLFASYSYVSPMMTEVTGYGAGAVTWLLILFGVGFFTGNLLGGKAADRAPMATILVLFTALTVVLGTFTFTSHYKIPAAVSLFLLGAVVFGTVPPLQTRVMQEAPGAGTLASAANIAGFNLGNAIGAWAGGLAISSGLTYDNVNWVGALLSASGLVLAVIAATTSRRGTTAVASQEPDTADRVSTRV